MKYLVNVCVAVQADSQKEAEGAAIKKITAGIYDSIEVFAQEGSCEDRTEAERDALIDASIGDEGELA